MGMFATLKDHDKCPKCGSRADWQSKSLWLTYKGRDFWIGDYGNIELDENMHGEIVAWGYPKEIGGCGHATYYKIRKGKLIESTETEYRDYSDNITKC